MRLLLVLIPVFLFSLSIDKEFLKDKPRSVAKDFYIYRYLKQNITPNDALWALSQSKNPTYKIFDAFAKKFKDKDTLKVAQCLKYRPNRYLKEDVDCIEIGLSTYKATKLTKNQLDKIIKKVKTYYPNSAKRFNIIASREPFLDLIKVKPKIFFDTFNQCGSKFREKYFNHHLPLKLLNKLKQYKKFRTTIKLIVTNPKLIKLQQSLLNIKNVSTLDHFSIFFLGLNAIVLEKYDLAKIYLKQALKKAYYKFDIDKSLFWLYQISKDKKYLIKLSNSWDVNIYSIYAKEKLNKKFDNIYYSIPQLNKKTKFNYKSQFAWIEVLKDIKKLNKAKFNKYKTIFSDNYTLGHLAFIYEKFYRYKKQYFVKPFYDITKQFDLKKQALIYAIMRQESRYIPSSISISYALGAMQIMPFLSKSIAKKLNIKYDIDEQFNPKINIKMASYHLDYLSKHLKNPLFIAYAYNGGIGFTKRVLKTHFKYKQFEPFLSMELIPYSESRRYGKKVLANYWVYYNEFEKIKLQKIIDSIFHTSL